MLTKKQGSSTGYLCTHFPWLELRAECPASGKLHIEGAESEAKAAEAERKDAEPKQEETKVESEVPKKPRGEIGNRRVRDIRKVHYLHRERVGDDTIYKLGDAASAHACRSIWKIFQGLGQSVFDRWIILPVLGS